MKYILRSFYKLHGWALELLAKRKIFKLKNGEYRIVKKIPYVCQYESKEFAARYVEGEKYLREDHRWRGSGAETIDEYVFWAPKLCGMACFKMILLSLSCPTAKLIELGRQAMTAGCYLKNPENPKRLIGLLHRPFLKFARSFGFDGKLLWYVGPNAVASEILSAKGGSASGGKDHFVIASVSNQIRHKSARPENKTGHLVLVHGFKVSCGEILGFYIHNPSGFYGESQENHFVSIEDFTNCFSGRIISLWEKNFQ